jgi:hypothetical protein
MGCHGSIVPQLATRSRTSACSSLEIQGMGKYAHRMCKHFGLVRGAPVLDIPSEDASPRSGRSERLGRRRRLGEFNDRQPTSLAQVASERDSAS